MASGARRQSFTSLCVRCTSTRALDPPRHTGGAMAVRRPRVVPPWMTVVWKRACNVCVAIEGQSTPAGGGPYWAYEAREEHWSDDRTLSVQRSRACQAASDRGLCAYGKGAPG